MAIEEIPLATDPAPEPSSARSRGLWRDAFRETLRKKSARAGFWLLGFLLVLAALAPVLAPYGPNQVLLPATSAPRPTDEGAAPATTSTTGLVVSPHPTALGPDVDDEEGEPDEDTPGEEEDEEAPGRSGDSDGDGGESAGPIPVGRNDPPCVHLLGCDERRSQHLLGIDGNGRDVFSRIVFGARISLLAGVAAVSFAVVVGTMIGLVSGFFGRWVDTGLMRAMDVLLAFPALLLAITIVTVLGRGMFNAVIAISVVTIPVYARVVRSSVLSVREHDYVAADRALGVSSARILWHRILPNSLTPLVVQATLGIATAVLEIAALSFLGLGIQPPTAEWGSMLAQHRGFVFTAPHTVFFPGLMIMLNVLAFNLIGDGLRDALDPRLNR